MGEPVPGDAPRPRRQWWDRSEEIAKQENSMQIQIRSAGQ